MSDRITHDEACQMLSRFNASHWNDGREKARYTIPADPSRDDDIRMKDYIEQNRARDAALRAAGLIDPATGEVRKAKKWEAAMLRNTQRTAEDIDARIRRLTDEDTKVSAAVFEMFENCHETAQGYLCNYDSAKDGNGKQHQIIDVLQELSAHMCREYRNLTGKEYENRFVRTRAAAESAGESK